MIDIVALAASGLAFFVVAVSPGPATISNATIAMSHGRRTSLIYGAGLSTGLVFWGVIAATGMGALLQGSLYLLMVLKVLGGLYLLWLAYQSARSAWQHDSVDTDLPNDNQWFLRGLILNLSNPKSVIAWMAALSIGIDPSAGIGAVITATLVCIFVGFLTNGLYSILFSINGMMIAYQRFRRKIQGIVSVLFSMAGVGLIRSAFTQN